MSIKYDTNWCGLAAVSSAVGESCTDLQGYTMEQPDAVSKGPMAALLGNDGEEYIAATWYSGMGTTVLTAGLSACKCLMKGGSLKDAEG